MKKNLNFQKDEWVLYVPFPADGDRSYNKPKRSVILEVFDGDSYYDYEIFVDGEGNIKKVKAENLFPVTSA
jgi:hypothetical protein